MNTTNDMYLFSSTHVSPHPSKHQTETNASHTKPSNNVIPIPYLPHKGNREQENAPETSIIDAKLATQ